MKTGDLFKHYKGSTYEIVTLATVEATHEEVVVYRNVNGGPAWTRPLDLFTGTVEHEGKTVKRFEPVSKSPEILATIRIELTDDGERIMHRSMLSFDFKSGGPKIKQATEAASDGLEAFLNNTVSSRHLVDIATAVKSVREGAYDEWGEAACGTSDLLAGPKLPPVVVKPGRPA